MSASNKYYKDYQAEVQSQAKILKQDCTIGLVVAGQSPIYFHPSLEFLWMTDLQVNPLYPQPLHKPEEVKIVSVSI